MSIFSDILLLSRQMEYERVHRELNEVLQDEFVIDVKMQEEMESGKFIFPDVDVVKTDKRVLTRQQTYFSAKINICESALYFHRHNFVELLYMYKGCCQQFIENLNHMAGYRNSTPIYQGIRQKFGMSPTEYRNGRYK